jgi:hypothetical protein
MPRRLNLPLQRPGKSFDEMMQNFELQRDKALASHVCTDHPKARPKR